MSQQIKRKTPSGLETSNTRGAGYRFHRHSDFSCEIDSEPLHFGCSHWISQLCSAMEDGIPFSELSKIFPELTFGTTRSKRKPTGHDFIVEWRTAVWRHADWRKT